MSEEEVAQIRRIRHEISAEGGHDVRRVVAYYRAIEEELRNSGEFCFESTRARATTGGSVDKESR